ncbi:MAG: hypothetical protein M3P93_16390, partial [Actinomycetota bacterium]|nr:hypothetical protein [Actinomycetota bacterium]
EQDAEQRRELTRRELEHARRDAELQVAGMLAQARAQAGDQLAQARREIEELRRDADQQLTQTRVARDRLTAEVVALADDLARVAARLREG